MGSKEDCVVLGPVFVALQILVKGAKSLKSRESLFRFGFLFVLGLFYLSLAFKPELWANRSGVGQYDIDLRLVAKSLRSVGVLFWPKRIVADNFPSWSFYAGVALTIATLVLAGIDKRRRPCLIFGLFICYVGMIAVLPGPDAIVANRYVYFSVCGAALVMAATMDFVVSKAGKKNHAALRLSVFAAFGVWFVVQVLAVKSVDHYHFEAAGNRCLQLLRGTRNQILPSLNAEHPRSEMTVFLAPSIWNELDYIPLVSVFLGVSKKDVSMTMEPYGPAFLNRLRDDGDLALSKNAVFAQVQDQEIQRMNSIPLSLVDLWSERAGQHEGRGKGHTIAVIKFHRLTP